MKAKGGERKEESVALRLSKGGKKRMKRARTRKNIESPAHIQIEREIKLARTIPARNASENHISGSFVVNCSCMRLDAEELAACIDVFHHSIELMG